ncbi:hypothetical protein SBA4_2200004 [Candidatus Sulfopaludibacter sp. SbA4]|nr:hypothetical protein SBA4_2200004 [Candidatus Sulfopaludibacter sp. SbA4]
MGDSLLENLGFVRAIEKQHTDAVFGQILLLGKTLATGDQNFKIQRAIERSGVSLARSQSISWLVLTSWPGKRLDSNHPQRRFWRPARFTI